MKKLILALALSLPVTLVKPLDNQVVVNGKKFVLSISRDAIDKRVKVLGEQISKDYANKKPIFVGVLNGAFMFLSDLMKEVKGGCEVDFIKISSYGNDTKSSGTIKMTKDVSCKPAGRDIIIVEDIVDSGLTIQFVRDHILKLNPQSVRIATLLHKKDQSKIDFPIDYVGFEIAPEFVVGYGLDFAQEGRNLPDIYKAVEE